MGMPVHTRKFTADELADFPDDGNRYEVIEGELYVTPGPLIAHQRVQMQLIRELDAYTRSCGLELLIAPTAVRSSPVTEVQPDLLVFSGAMDDVENSRQVRMSALWLAVEILSPSTLRLDRVRKRKAYLVGGVREYWIADGKARAVEVWSPGQTEARVERGELAWQPRAERPALTIDLVALFRDVRGVR
jgi:Uma2 family endonuclease